VTGVLQILENVLNLICSGSYWSFSGVSLLNWNSNLLACTGGSLPSWLLTIRTTNTVQQNPSEIHRILWNTKIPPLAHIQSQTNPFHTSYSNLLRSITSSSHTSVSSKRFLSGFRIQTLHAFLCSLMRATSPANTCITVYFNNNTFHILGKESKNSHTLIIGTGKFDVILHTPVLDQHDKILIPHAI